MQRQGAFDKYQHIIDWVLRLIRLDLTPFEEARRDQTATVPIVGLVAVLSLLSGLGSFLWGIVNVEGLDAGEMFVDSFVVGSIIQFALWFAWVFIAYLVLTQVFRAAADLTQLLRVMGLAFVPIALAAIMFIPVVDFSIGLISVVATVLLANVALQNTTSATPGQAMGANLAGFAVLSIVLGLVASENNIYAPGFFAMEPAKDAFLNIADAVSGFFDDI
jgi:hypothetical protein